MRASPKVSFYFLRFYLTNSVRGTVLDFLQYNWTWERYKFMGSEKIIHQHELTSGRHEYWFANDANQWSRPWQTCWDREWQKFVSPDNIRLQTRNIKENYHRLFIRIQNFQLRRKRANHFFAISLYLKYWLEENLNCFHIFLKKNDLMCSYL